MIEQQYQLQILYGNDWQDVEKFDDRNLGLKALRVLQENGSSAGVRLLECSFDTDENRIVASRPIEPGFCAGEVGAESIDESENPPAGDDDKGTEPLPTLGKRIIEKSQIPSDVRPLVNLLTIFAIGVLILIVIDRYSQGNGAIFKDICSMYRFESCQP